MKQTNLLKTFLLLCALVVGSTCAWATEKSYTLTFKTSGTTNDGSTAWGTSSKVSDVLTAGGDYVSSISAVSNVYPGRDGRGAKFGSSSKAGNITFALSNDGKVKATKVVIKGGAYIASGKAEAAAVKVNNGTAVDFDQTVTTYTEEDITYNFPTATDITSLTLTQVTANKGRFYVVSVTVYYEEDAAEGETATWTLDPTSASVMAGQSTTLQLTTNYDGTLNFQSNDTDVATVSYNSTTKVITVTGVAAGTTTISATGAATATYKAISKSIDVTVSHAELASNVTDVMSGFGYSYFGLTPSGSNTYVQPDVTSTDKTDAYGVTISWARAGSSNSKPRFDANCVRYYAGNTLTVTAPAGSYITKIVFTEPASGKDWSGTMASVSKGEYVSSEKTWYADVENIDEVVFTNDATKRIGGMKVYLNASTVPVTISSTTGFATAFTYAPLDFSSLSSELKAYTATVSGNTVTLTQVDNVPANTGIVLKGDVKTHNVPVIASSTTDKGDLTGSVTEDLVYDSEATKDYFYLGINAGKAQFKRLTSGSIGAGKAYLALDKSTTARELDVVFDETTAIETVKSEKASNEYFNLAGQRVAQPTKGLYIVNGKKVVIK